MALSQDEQRILAEIEQRLTSDDPGLASSLAALRRPGPAKLLRSPRVRIVGSLFTVLLVAMVSVTVYAMIPFRALQSRQAPPASVAATTNQPTTAQQSAASGGTGSTASTRSAASTSTASGTVSAASTVSATGQNSSGRSTSSTAAASKSQPAKVTAQSHELFPTTNANP